MIDMNKEYVTKGEGLPVRIYCTDAGGDHPVHGAVLSGGVWRSRVWREDGSGVGNDYSLIEKRQTIMRWVNVYEDGGLYGSYGKRSEADELSDGFRIGVLRIEITGDKYDVFKEDV